MLLRLDQLSRESERLKVTSSAMREEIVALRRALATHSSLNVYQAAAATLGPGERTALGEHQLEFFPVWAIAVLHLLTFGLFSVIFFGVQQGRMPRAAPDDPSTASSIGYHFIPFFGLYWIFFNSLRLCERLTLQFRLRGVEESAPSGLVLASAILSVIPYFNLLLGIPILWCISACILQSRINRLIELGPVEIDALSLPQRSVASG